MRTQLVFVDEEIVCDLPSNLDNIDCHYISTIYLNKERCDALSQKGWRSVLCIHRGLHTNQFLTFTNTWAQAFSLSSICLFVGTSTSHSEERHRHRINVINQLTLHHFSLTEVWVFACPFFHQISYQDLTSLTDTRIRKVTVPTPEHTISASALFETYRKMLVESVKNLAAVSSRYANSL